MQTLTTEDTLTAADNTVAIAGLTPDRTPAQVGVQSVNHV